MKTNAFLFILLFFGYVSAEKYFSLSPSYAYLDLPESYTNHGGSLSISGIEIKNNLVYYGGYGDLLFTRSLFIGEGGVKLGLSSLFNYKLFYSFGLKAGLGGGTFFDSDAGSTYHYGIDLSFGIVKKKGLGLNISYEKINNMSGFNSLNENGVDNLNIGINFLLREK